MLIRKISRFIFLNFVFIFSISLISTILADCSSQESKVAYFKQHPDQAQSKAIECVGRAKQGENIEKDTSCMAVVAYEQEKCERAHQEGAVFYLQYDCSHKVQMMGLAMEGY